MPCSLKRSVLLCSALVISGVSAHADIWGELESEAQDVGAAAPASVAKEVPSEFDLYKQRQQEEFAAYKRIFAEEFQNYQQAILNRWDSVDVSSQKVWVSYTQDYGVKRAVDFEKKTLTITSLDVAANQKTAYAQFEAQIRQVITATVAEAFDTDQYLSSVESRIKSEGVKAKTAKVPNSSLFGLPTDKDKREAIEKRVKSLARKLELKQAEKGKAVTATIDLAPVLKASRPRSPGDGVVYPVPARAEGYVDRVLAEAERRQLDASLVLAVIQTESAFNPMAQSAVPAYGLMQIVPKTAGLDATEYVYGKQTLLAPSALFNPDQNIELGAAYLWILNNRYLKSITNPESRYYCMVAAYNTGAGNVAKAFTGKRNVNRAAKIINKMSADEVYAHLVKNLPYEETQNYLKKVVKREKNYKDSNKN